MIPRIDEKQISIKLNETLVGRLDVLAKKGELNRNHLMLSFVNIWSSVLEEANLPGLFYIANLLRVRENQMKGDYVYEHEFTESRLPEKPFPIKFSESSVSNISAFASVNHVSRHLLLKTMIIVGIEELENITDGKNFQFGVIEPELHKRFSLIMKKGLTAFKAYLK
jgi:hypothetical protein